jgi:hypothetical protein
MIGLSLQFQVRGEWCFALSSLFWNGRHRNELPNQSAFNISLSQVTEAQRQCHSFSSGGALYLVYIFRIAEL